MDGPGSALAEPGRLAAALGYYRATFDPSLHLPALATEQAATFLPVPQPTLYFHGRHDGCIGRDSFAAEAVLEQLGPGSRMLEVEGAGHFAHLERPGAVNAAILVWLSA